MELIEIIQSSITFFSAFTVLLMFLSYLVYKLRDRTRLKPYELISEKETSLKDLSKVNTTNYAPEKKVRTYAYTAKDERIEDYSSYQVVRKEKKNMAKFTIVSF